MKQRIHRILARLLSRLPGAGGRGERKPDFEVRAPGKDVLLFRAGGPQPLFTQVALDLVRRLPSPMGLVLVEYRPGPREWTSSYLGRSRTLSALVQIRDLLGAAGVDVAVVSPPLGLEIIIDHLGVLEVRTGAWNEAMVRRAFTEAGYVERREDAVEEAQEPAVLTHNPAHWARIDALVKDLKLKPATRTRSAEG